MEIKKQYDNKDFFEKYSQMPRSNKGLAAAGEWHEFKKLLPDFEGKVVLDLGCGYGWHAKYAADHGAKEVIAIDSSEKMIEVAKKTNFDDKITYEVDDIASLNLKSDYFDIVLSSLVLHYIEDLNSLFKNLANSMKDNAYFLFTVEHPVFTAEGSQDWIYDKKGNISHFPIDNYFNEGLRESTFLNENIQKFHHTLTSYFQALKESHFIIDSLIEPMPPEEMRDLPEMVGEMRRPMMLIIKSILNK